MSNCRNGICSFICSKQMDPKNKINKSLHAAQQTPSRVENNIHHMPNVVKHSTTISIHVGTLWHIMNKKKAVAHVLEALFYYPGYKPLQFTMSLFFHEQPCRCRKEQRGFSEFLRPKEIATDFLGSECP